MTVHSCPALHVARGLALRAPEPHPGEGGGRKVWPDEAEGPRPSASRIAYGFSGISWEVSVDG